MIVIRKSDQRGHFDHGWLDTCHTFSFGDYYDPQYMGFRSLRVINEDRVAPSRGFATHGHRDMEIVTYIVSGTLEHKDSMGSISRLKPGDVQHMTAGSGITHSEYNPSALEEVHLLQIWIQPRELNLVPSYQEMHFDKEQLQGKLCLISAPDGQDGALPVEQDVRVYAGLFDPQQSIRHHLATGRHAWVQVVRGEVVVHGQDGLNLLTAGDGAACSQETELVLDAQVEAEVLLFDLA